MEALLGKASITSVNGAVKQNNSSCGVYTVKFRIFFERNGAAERNLAFYRACQQARSIICRKLTGQMSNHLTYPLFILRGGVVPNLALLSGLPQTLIYSLQSFYVVLE